MIRSSSHTWMRASRLIRAFRASPSALSQKSLKSTVQTHVTSHQQLAYSTSQSLRLSSNINPESAFVTGSASSSATASSSSQAETSSSEDAEPINPEDHARLNSQFTDEADEDERLFREEDSDPERTAQVKRLLSASLKFVPVHGWSVTSMQEGARSLGWSTAAHGLANRGPVELVYALMDQAEENMLTKLEQAVGEKLSTSNKLALAIRYRLETFAPYISQWPQAMALTSQPQHAARSLCKLQTTIDRIWYAVGDKSTNMTYYSKRAILTGVYVATELFMLSDRSPDFQSTWSFLRRRLDHAQELAMLPTTITNSIQTVINLGGLVVENATKRR